MAPAPEESPSKRGGWWPSDLPDLVSEVMGAIELVGSVQVRAEANGAWGVRWEAGRPAMFHLMERGEAWIRVPEQLPVHLVPGAVVLLKPGIAHDVVGSPTGRAKRAASPSERPLAASVSYQLGRGEPHAVVICGAFHFRRTVEHPLLALLPPVLHVPATDAPDAAAMATLLRQVEREAAEGRPGSDLIVRRLTDVLFVQILRSWFEAQPLERGGWLAAASDPQIGAALRAIHLDPRRRWTVVALAREAAMSRSVFAARFAELAGEPPVQYVARWRALLAARALRERDETVASIAAGVGYASLASFVRAFRRFVGASPAEYRSQSTPGQHQTPSAAPR